MDTLRRRRAHRLLNQAEKVKLRELIEEIERTTAGEICVLLVHDVAHPKQFALEYFNHLGIGKKDLHNGILILVVLDKRRIELVIGDGLHGVIPQTVLDRVISETLAPHFRAGKFGEGLHRAVETIGQALRDYPPQGPKGSHRHLPGVVDLD